MKSISLKLFTPYLFFILAVLVLGGTGANGLALGALTEIECIATVSD